MGGTGDVAVDGSGERHQPPDQVETTTGELYRDKAEEFRKGRGVRPETFVCLADMAEDEMDEEWRCSKWHNAKETKDLRR